MEIDIIASVAGGLLIWKAIKIGIDMAMAKRNKKNGNPGHLGKISDSLESIDETLDVMRTDIAVIKDRTK